MSINNDYNSKNIPLNTQETQSSIIHTGPSKITELYYQTLCPNTPPLRTPATNDLLSDTILSRICTHFPMTSKDRTELQGQIVTALAFIENNRDEFIKAKKDQYFRPQDYKAEKFGKFKDGGKYTGAHIQISKEGDIIIIPKHQCLVSGSGSSKAVRVGYNLETGKFIAAASILGDSFLAELELIRLREMGVDLAYVAYGPKTKAALPLAEQGDLSKQLRAINANPKRKIKVASGCIDRIAEQHQMNLVNRDVKLRNFLLGANDEVYCFDLGQADHNAKGIHKYKGAPAFSAPEIFAAQDGNGDPDELGFAVDIYALGIVLYTLETGTESNTEYLPWLNSSMIKYWINENGEDAVEDYLHEWTMYTCLPEDAEYFAPNDIMELIGWMTHPFADQRPTIAQVKEHHTRLTRF